MAKILEVGDFIYDDNRTPHNRYEVTAVTAKMCTIVNKSTGKTAKAKRQPDADGRYALHGIYGWGWMPDVKAKQYYLEYMNKVQEQNRVTKMQNQMYHVKWREIPAEKLDLITKILNNQ